MWASAAVNAAVIANAQNDYLVPGIQGSNNWYYGYYSGPFQPSNFTLIDQFVGQDWVVATDASVWTSVFREGARPNGAISSGGRTPVEQWPVRRWVSPIEGSLMVYGAISDGSTDGGIGDGVIARIFLDDTEVLTRTYLPSTNVFVYGVNVMVSPGSTLDFVVDPREDDISDSTYFTVLIEVIPEPSSALLVLTGMLATLSRRYRIHMVPSSDACATASAPAPV
jgi:hypothetical protein